MPAHENQVTDSFFDTYRLKTHFGNAEQLFFSNVQDPFCPGFPQETISLIRHVPFENDEEILKSA